MSTVFNVGSENYRLMRLIVNYKIAIKKKKMNKHNNNNLYLVQNVSVLPLFINKHTRQY